MHASIWATAALALAAGLAPAAYADDDKDESGKGRDRWSQHDGKDQRKADEEWRKREDKRAEEWRKRDEKRREAIAKGRDDDRLEGRRDHYFRDRGYAQVRVPPGHLPPPGECRIWHPDRPAGHQPPPGRCSRLASQVPAGAWLIERPSGNQRYHVSAYEAHGVVIDRAAYDFRSGVLVLLAQLR
jgi:hypothetical protein